eukprot:Gb_28592 [translate_table: standard]
MAEGGASSSAHSSSHHLQGKEEEMVPIHRSSSRPQLDLSGAAIQGNFEDHNPTILLPNQSDDISHFAVDLGGSLIKLVYFSRHAEPLAGSCRKKSTKETLERLKLGRRSYPILGGRLHFVKFETSKLNDCLDFINSKRLQCAQSPWVSVPARALRMPTQMRVSVWTLENEFCNDNQKGDFEFHFLGSMDTCVLSLLLPPTDHNDNAQKVSIASNCFFIFGGCANAVY